VGIGKGSTTTATVLAREMIHYGLQCGRLGAGGGALRVEGKAGRAGGEEAGWGGA